MTLHQIKPSLIPIGDIGGTAGYTTTPLLSVTNAATHDSDKATKAVRAAGKYLNDPYALSLLTERVYELLLQDMRYQQERVINYGKQGWL